MKVVSRIVETTPGFTPWRRLGRVVIGRGASGQ